MRSDDSIAKQALSRHHRVREIEDYQRTSGKEIWRKKCGQQVSDTAGGRWRRQHNTELDGDKWSVAYEPLGVTRLESIRLH